MEAHELEPIRHIAQRLAVSERAVAFTGAGISTESGISDFRSPGGVWSRYRPVTIQEFMESHDARRRYWVIKKEAHRQILGAQPNTAHRVLAELEADGKIRAVITQNIDGLHQVAGSKKVLEIHGNTREALCLDCDRRFPIDTVQERLEAGEDVPTCSECGGWLKPATVSFGQALPAKILAESEKLSCEADLFLAIGSSLVVTPAASLPVLARQNGAYVAIINRDETPLDSMADQLVRTPIGVSFQELARLYELYRKGIA